MPTITKINIEKPNKTKKSHFFGDFSFKDLIHWEAEEPKSEQPPIVVEKVPETRVVYFNLNDENTNITKIPDTVIQTGIISDMTPFEIICDNSDGTWLYDQGKVADIWKKDRTSNREIATINNRYLVAVNERFGKVGDNIDVILEDGTKINCTIMDIKRNDDPSSSPYGHYFQSPSGTKQESLIEWEVTKNVKDTDMLNQLTSDWHGKKVVSIENIGTNIIK